MYYGGSLRGIRELEGKHKNGWESFGELKCFFMGVGWGREARAITLNSRHSDEGVGVVHR